MADFRPHEPFNVPMLLLFPRYEKINGVAKKTFSEENSIQFFGSFQTFGGTEKTVNGVYSIEDTANVVTWFFPELKADCGVKLLDDGATYEIIGTPENINRRNQFLKFKLRRIGGGA